MNILKILLISITLIAAQTQLAPHQPYSSSIKTPDKDYTMYVFATTWPGSSCLFKKCRYFPQPKFMNIHGLWPSSIGGKSPFECQVFRFDESNIDPAFKLQLYTYWAGLWTPNWDFIRYEMKKHGSCWKKELSEKQKTDPKINEMIDNHDSTDSFGLYNVFLKISVYLSQKLDTFTILDKAGIVPSDTQYYPLADILSAINKHHGLTTACIPVCMKNKAMGFSVISEFRFCFDLNYEPIDCDPMVVRRNIQACGKDPIGYPELKDHSLDLMKQIKEY